MSNEIIRLQNLLTKLNNLVGKKTEVDDSSSSSLTHPLFSKYPDVDEKLKKGLRNKLTNYGKNKLEDKDIEDAIVEIMLSYVRDDDEILYMVYDLTERGSDIEEAINKSFFFIGYNEGNDRLRR